MRSLEARAVARKVRTGRRAPKRVTGLKHLWERLRQTPAIATKARRIGTLPPGEFERCRSRIVGPIISRPMTGPPAPQSRAGPGGRVGPGASLSCAFPDQGAGARAVCQGFVNQGSGLSDYDDMLNDQGPIDRSVPNRQLCLSRNFGGARLGLSFAVPSNALSRATLVR